ncbi:hypothetical protein EDB87DRAFT_680878 [Lactarius vividus]|nr:hypothetical protein EDB87DRAFT_680878 [Lactarius vividus]
MHTMLPSPDLYCIPCACEQLPLDACLDVCKELKEENLKAIHRHTGKKEKEDSPDIFSEKLDRNHSPSVLLGKDGHVVAVQVVVSHAIIDGGGAATAVYVGLGGSVELLGTIDARGVAAAVVQVVQLGSGEVGCLVVTRGIFFDVFWSIGRSGMFTVLPQLSPTTGESLTGIPGAAPPPGPLSTERRAGEEARKADLCERDDPGQ